MSFDELIHVCRKALALYDLEGEPAEHPGACSCAYCGWVSGIRRLVAEHDRLEADDASILPGEPDAADTVGLEAS